MLAAALHVRDVADDEALNAAVDLITIRARSIDPHVTTVVLQPDLAEGAHVVSCSLTAAATSTPARRPDPPAIADSDRSDAQQVAAILGPLSDVRLAAGIVELCTPRPADGDRHAAVLWLDQRRLELLDGTTMDLSLSGRAPATIPQALASVRATAAEVARASAHAAASALTLATARNVTGTIATTTVPAGLSDREHQLVADALLRILEIYRTPPCPGTLELRPDARQASWICQRTHRRRTLPVRALANIPTIGATR